MALNLVGLAVIRALGLLLADGLTKPWASTIATALGAQGAERMGLRSKIHSGGGRYLDIRSGSSAIGDSEPVLARTVRTVLSLSRWLE